MANKYNRIVVFLSILLVSYYTHVLIFAPGKLHLCLYHQIQFVVFFLSALLHQTYSLVMCMYFSLYSNSPSHTLHIHFLLSAKKFLFPKFRFMWQSIVSWVCGRHSPLNTLACLELKYNRIMTQTVYIFLRRY